MSPLFLKIINLAKWKTTDLFPYLVSFLNVWSDVYISMYIKDFWFGTFPSISGSGYTLYRAPIRTNNYCPMFCCNWKTWRNGRVKMYTELYCQLYKEMRIAYTLSRSNWCVRVITVSQFFPSWQVLFSVECTCIVPVCVFVCHMFSYHPFYFDLY